MKIHGPRRWSIGLERGGVVAALVLAWIVAVSGTAFASPSRLQSPTPSPESLTSDGDARGAGAPAHAWLSGWIESDSTIEVEPDQAAGSGLPAEGVRIEGASRVSCPSDAPRFSPLPALSASNLSRAPPQA